jgi:hypothetical protein
MFRNTLIDLTASLFFRAHDKRGLNVSGFHSKAFLQENIAMMSPKDCKALLDIQNV